MTFYHHLKLFSTEPDIVTGKKPFVNEYYDELVIFPLRHCTHTICSRSSKNRPLCSPVCSAVRNLCHRPPTQPSPWRKTVGVGNPLVDRLTRTGTVSDALEKTETRKRIRTARLRIRGEVQQLTERLRIAQGNLKRVRQRPVDNVVAPGTFRAITRENSTHDGSFL